MGNPRYSSGFAVTLHEDLVDKPLSWRTPRLVFVNSMSDLFHPDVPSGFIQAVFETMRTAERHTFQVLTKRPKRAAALSDRLPWPDNVWLGVSVEDQERAWRVAELAAVPAAVRFVSAEPLLGPVSLDLGNVDWLIAGGESGPAARPPQLGWIRALRDACRDEDVAFFFKQWGGRTPKAGGRELDGRTWDEMPIRAAA